MGKNRKKRPLDISSSSSNLGDVSLKKNSPEAEKPWDANPKNQILSASREAKKLFAFKDCVIENNENTKENEYIEVDDTSDAADEVRNLSNSYDNLQGLQGRGVTPVFESYVQLSARRRSQSLENRLDHKVNAKNLSKEVFLKVTPSQKVTDRCVIDGKDSNIHHLTHPKKKN